MTAKRGNNEGSVYQRHKDGPWYGAVSIGYMNGKLTVAIGSEDEKGPRKW